MSRDIKYMISVMQAYDDGKEIEFKRKDDPIWSWSPLITPRWNWHVSDYRIKPDSKYVPYDSVAEVEKDKWIVSKDSMAIYRIGAIDRGDATVYLVSNDWVSLEELFEHYTYEDGTPCGKKVEE